MRSRTLLRLSGMELTIFLNDSLAARIGHAKRHLSQVFGRSRPEAAAPARAPQAVTPEAQALLDQVQTTEWYHSIDLGHGVVTPGFFDHRPLVHKYHLPDDLSGKRALDVATYNGFWALEFEKRHAAEVVGVDVECMDQVDLAPAVRARMSEQELRKKTGTGFEIVRRALGSQVRREILSVYDLAPERLGMFDLVFCGDLLLHLTNPIRALQRIRSVCSGHALLAELYDPNLDRCGPYKLMNYHGGVEDFVWWTFGLTTLEQMIRDAGFRRVELLESFVLIPTGMKTAPPHAVFRAEP